MLSVLSKLNLNRQQENEILLSMIKDYLPSPQTIASSLNNPAQTQIRDDILIEVRRRLRINLEDQSDRAKAMILGFLADEVGNYVSTPISSNTIKSRLGDQGFLRADQYEIKFGDTFQNVFIRLGLTRAEARDVITHPDQVQHHTPPDAFNPDKDGELSIYCKTYTNTEPDKTYTVLINGRRQGYVIAFMSGWLVYHSDVDISSAQTPLEMLEAFAKTYGITFSVGKSLPNKFFYYESIPIIPQSHTQILGFPSNLKNLLGELVTRVSSLGFVEVRSAYVIDVSKYVNDLKKHGVNAALPENG